MVIIEPFIAMLVDLFLYTARQRLRTRSQIPGVLRLPRRQDGNEVFGSMVCVWCSAGVRRNAVEALVRHKCGGVTSAKTQAVAWRRLQFGSTMVGLVRV